MAGIRTQAVSPAVGCFPGKIGNPPEKSGYALPTGSLARNATKSKFLFRIDFLLKLK